MVDLSAMSCSSPKATAAAVAEVALVATNPTPQRPPDYVCCPPGRFGCQPGSTPTNATGFLPDVLPFDSISGWPGDFIWMSVGVVVPHTLLIATGNVNALSRVWPMTLSLLEATDRESKGGLIGWGPYADWLSEEKVSQGFAENFYFARAAAQAAELAGALGLPADAAALTALYAAISAAMVGKYFAGGVWDGAQGNMNAQGMALAVGLGGGATANATASILAALVADAERHGNHPTGGVASSRWVLAGMDAGGRADLALAMATVPTPPSWAFMVEREDMPGTIWEAGGNELRRLIALVTAATPLEPK